MRSYTVDNAIILAAGLGTRLGQLTENTPKGLIQVRGEPLVERTIKQLLEVGISEIVIIVGYLKEKFNYLVEKYGVILVENPDYATKNNISSIYHALPFLGSSYLVCSDQYMENNFFKTHEPQSWYCVKHFIGETNEWCVETDTNGLITNVIVGGKNQKAIFGPAFFSSEFSKKFSEFIKSYYSDQNAGNYFWEDVWARHLDELPTYANERNDVYEFDSLSDLEDFCGAFTC